MLVKVGLILNNTSYQSITLCLVSIYGSVPIMRTFSQVRT